MQAFGIKSAQAGLRQARRTLEIENRKLHIPVVNRAAIAEEAPPLVVVVMGPPGVGKSTLVRSLVKHYTKHNLHEIKGPITVVSGKLPASSREGNWMASSLHPHSPWLL